MGVGDARATPPTSVAARREPYRSKLTLDFAAGDAVVIPGYGGAQGFFFVASDLLGDNLLFGSLGSFQGRQLGSIFANISATAVYLNQSRRVNWGFGAFRTKSRNFEGDRVVAYDETAYGVHRAAALPAHAASPGSRARRSLEHSDRVDFTLPVDEPRRVGWIASHYLSYVHDNSLWLASGPIDGGRLALTAGALQRLHQQPVRQLPRQRRLAALFPAGPAERLGAPRLRLLQRRRPAPPDQHRRHHRAARVPAVRLHRRLRRPSCSTRSCASRSSPTSPSAPRSATCDFPEIQGGALHRCRQGHVLHHASTVRCWAATGLASAWRWDRWRCSGSTSGRRFSDDNFRGYSLSPDQRNARLRELLLRL